MQQLNYDLRGPNLSNYNFELLQCNKQADKLFGVNLSLVNDSELLNSQYLILKQRCLVQMKETERYVGNYNDMESLATLETGLAVLTLEEALQTFETESQLFRL